MQEHTQRVIYRTIHLKKFPRLTAIIRNFQHSISYHMMNSEPIEQSNDVILQELRLRALKEDYSATFYYKITAITITVANMTYCPSLMKLLPDSLSMKQGM